MPFSVPQELERTAVARAWIAEGRNAALKMPTQSDSLQYVMRMTAHPGQDAFVVKEVFLPALGALYAMSGGRIVPQGIWGEKAHPAAHGFEALKDGRSDLAPCYTAWRASEYPVLQLLALPGLFQSSEVATDVSEQLYLKYFRREFEKSGVLMGRLKATGGYHVFSHKPITKLKDFSGLSIAVNDGVDRRIADMLGAQTVVLSSVELLPAFERGDVVAVSLADGSADVFGIGIRSRYRLELGVSMMNLEFGLSSAFYGALPADLRLVVNNWLRIQAQVETQILYGLGGALAREKFIRHGCQFVDLEPGERDKLDICLPELTAQLVKELDHKGCAASDMVAEAQILSRAISDQTANALLRAAMQTPRMLLPL